MRRFTSEQLQTDPGAIRAEARRHPVEVTYRGRPELVVLSVEEYALLRENRKIGFHRDEMLREKVERIAANRMDPEHAGLDALLDE
jgi:PHD/YefM family antitoxin component YafN of YafNO toxin-antitoxin module